MRQLSLRVRSVLLAVALLALFAPFTVVILEEAYTKSLTQAKMSELRLMNLGLLSAFELDGDLPYMPEILYEEQLNLPGSGYLGIIVFRNEVICATIAMACRIAEKLEIESNIEFTSARIEIALCGCMCIYLCDCVHA